MSVINVTVTNAGAANVSVSSGSTVNATVGNGGAVNVSTGTISPGNATVVSGTLTINSTTTLAPGSNATVTNKGTAYAAVLDIGIPTGAAGPQGVPGPAGINGINGTNGVTPSFAIGNVVTGAAGSSASVTATPSNNGANVTLDLTIPRGDPGTNGTNGSTLTLSDATPSALGTASAGTSSTVSRADHTHQLPVIAYANLTGTPSNFPTNTALVSGLSAGYSVINHAHNYVTSLNNLTGALTLAAGSNVTLTSANGTVTINAQSGFDANAVLDGGEYIGEIVYSGTITITQQPQNQTASNGAASFSAAATVSPTGTLAYQWQRSDNNGSTWLTVAGATASNVALTNLTYAADNGDRYRVIVSSDSASSVTSNAAVLTVIDNWSGSGVVSSKWMTTTNFLEATFTAPQAGILYIDFDFTVNINRGYFIGFGVFKNGQRFFGAGADQRYAASINSSAWTTFLAGDVIVVRRETVAGSSLVLDSGGDVTINSMSLWLA